MGNEKEPTPGTRGWRLDLIRQDLGLDRQGFADRLAEKAAAMDVEGGGKWSPSRLSKLILSRQPISLDDAAVIVAVDPKKRGWDWFVLGESAGGLIRRIGRRGA